MARVNTAGPSKSGIQNSSYTYAADAEASDAYAITVSPAPSAYVAGQKFIFKANTANTGAASLNVNSLGAKTILKSNDQTLANSDIEVGSIVEVVYDGTNFQMTSVTAATAATGDVSGQASSVDSEIALFSGTGGKTIKRATTTGLLKAASGVIAAATAETDYVTPSGTGTLTNKTLTKPNVNGSVQGITAATDGATVTFDCSAANIHTVTLGGNRTLALSNTTAGQCLMLELKQDGTGSRTVTWFSGISWAGGSAPTLTTTAAKTDVIRIRVVTAGSAYIGYVIGQNI